MYKWIKSPQTETHQEKTGFYSGKLSTLISDDCKNYDPIRPEPKEVQNLKSDRLYNCRNWENDRILITSPNLEDYCLFCDNWQMPDGEYKNRPPEEVAIVFYKENSDKFIQYFQGRSPENKKKILKQIFECDFTNEKVIEWLNKKESSLVREVGISLV